jgi:hypothetical protein
VTVSYAPPATNAVQNATGTQLAAINSAIATVT